MVKKKAHRFGEVCRLLDVQPYVLRYWETEFPALAGDDAGGAQRTYTEEDLAVVQRIKELLYNESFTLVGAKKKLQAELDEGKLKLSTGAAAEEAAAVEAAEEVEEAAEPEAEEEADPQQAKEKAPRKKAASSKKKATKKQKAKKPAEADVDDSEAASADASALDLGELKAILGDARELLKQLQA